MTETSRLQRHIDSCQKIVDSQAQLLMKFRDYRMWIGLISLGLMIYSILNQSTSLLIGSAVGLFLFFPILVNCTNRAARKLKRRQNWVEFLNRQKYRKMAQWDKIKNHGDKTQRKNDLDILGWPSLFLYLDETVSQFGHEKLTEMLEQKNTENKINAEQIIHSQNQVIELSKNFFHVRRLLLGAWEFTDRIPSQKMVDFIKKPLTTSGFSKKVGFGVLLWAAAMISYPLSQELAIWPMPPLLLLAYWAFSASQMGQVIRSFQAALSIDRNYQQFSEWVTLIEKSSSCKIIAEICPKTTTQRPSSQLKKFSRIIAYLSIQANPLVFVAINAVFPWTLIFTWLLEKSRLHLEEQIESTLSEVADLETTWCRTILYKFHTKTMPTISTKPKLKVKKVIHPLIPSDQVIANDFEFPPDSKIGLITGSNMSGKSTFLRTLGLNQALAICGAPVFAESMITWPARIQSCLRVADSVEDGFSYFYSEVRRIKEIMDSLETGDSIFYLIDEVFKGTNNRERLIAARSLLNRLADFDSLGFVTTHDLELADLESSIDCLDNFHFSDRFEEDEMKFDYTVKAGPCTSTNALRILEREGLPVS